MRKLLAALVLMVLTTAATAAGTTEPIKPVPQELFKPVEIVDYGKYLNLPVVRHVPHIVFVKPKLKPKPPIQPAFKHDSEVSWYGPGFYGRRTACGLKYTTKLLGVAHKTLPCGTLVTFKYMGKPITVPVIDRGPYVRGRQWDLSGGLCVALKHCFTGPIEYRIGK